MATCEKLNTVAVASNGGKMHVLVSLSIAMSYSCVLLDNRLDVYVQEYKSSVYPLIDEKGKSECQLSLSY